MNKNLIYGVEVQVWSWGPVPAYEKPEWLNEIKGIYYFRNERQRRDFVNKLRKTLDGSHGGWDIDGIYEITNYGTWGICIDHEEFEEEFKPVSERRVKVRTRRA